MLKLADNLRLPIEAVTEKLERQRRYAREWRARNTERLRKYFGRYRAEHPHLKEKQAKYYLEHRDSWNRKGPASETEKARRRQLRAANRDAINATARAARAADPERFKANERRTRQKNALKKHQRDRRYRLDHPDIYKASTCHLCRQPVQREHLTFDHLIPVVRGGAFAEWNLMVAHDRCNKRRGTKQILPEENKESAVAYVSNRSVEASA